MTDSFALKIGRGIQLAKTILPSDKADEIKGWTAEFLFGFLTGHNYQWNTVSQFWELIK